MTDYKELAARIAAGRAATVQALQPAKYAARERRDELWKAQREGRAIALQQTQERSLLDSNIPGFFPTPPEVASRMIEKLNAPTGARLLEPSAGNGHIAEAAHTAGLVPYCIEKVYSLAQLLASKGFDADCRDFIEFQPLEPFPFVAMNPPFEHGQDIEHVLHAFNDCLAPGGKLVAIVSPGAFYRSDKKALAFQEWFDDNEGTQETLPPGTFKQAGTNISSVMIFVQKG